MSFRKFLPRLLFEGKDNEAKPTERTMETDVCDLEESDKSRKSKSAHKSKPLSMKRLSIPSKHVSEVNIQLSPRAAENIEISQTGAFKMGKLYNIVCSTVFIFAQLFDDDDMI